ncbi:hypothetical protein PC129_g4723 [Phytophthora cactorum]|nr:hypothetical protein Pcac1_g27959 [Phytophthora cactorum]KAG2796100.1 hypothetical protein PC112_g22349 [Phytophthora cactorum]KAG2823046.1 hypothetical protein PC113_g22242 [Phytophthora cactorum]KAG2875105.1 hypothetical protein PC114_g24925 [Phytophthora cactorum]KAG2881780.1 hypothetical protein PC115_g22122 [Phytophthora cactorum]
MGDRVLLSTAGIAPTSVTNELAPRVVGPFKVTKVVGDAYTLQLPPAIRQHPTFYVDRLRRYHPATIPGDADDHPRPSPRALHAPRPGSVQCDAARDSPAPADPDAARPQCPPSAHDPPFRRDGPAPLVDSASNLRHIVDRILEHDDLHGLSTLPPLRRGVTWCAGWAPCQIVGNLVPFFSPTFRTAWRRTRQASYRLRMARPPIAPCLVKGSLVSPDYASLHSRYWYRFDDPLPLGSVGSREVAPTAARTILLHNA